ncbi:hypothetical protein LC653_10010 [Nostoc sp. CHAB 5784]|uniref:hypothetical protein n=1 Tax=Nostoc mirabile TaxID=2907820 RepID=UPI001E5C2FF2|nr:hypothetical protein [Nostoc mirabile]MCC5664243.1 hypothetical protein [Nostoc mirabile CHAB5784]
MKLTFKSTECPAADYEFPTLYPTSFTVLDEMLAYSHYWTNQLVICINQDVPTYFHAVQRSRLPIVAMLLDRGLSDTNVGQAYHKYFTRKNLLNWQLSCLS